MWRAIQRGDCGVQRLTGVPGIPDGLMLGATVDIEGEFPGQLKNIPASAARRPPRHWPTPGSTSAVSTVTGSAARSVLHMGDTDYVVRAELSLPRQADSARQRAVVAAMVAEHGLFDGSERLRPARPAVEQLHGMCERHDRHFEGGSRDPGWPVRHRTRRQLRSDSPPVCRRFL